MKFLIAGLGSIGRRHLRNLVALGEREIILYRTRKATLPEDDLANFPVETDLQAALAHKPDAVIIANPTALHLEVAIPAARAGCSLLIEKPIAHSLEGVEDLQNALHQGGGRALVGFQFRFHPTLEQVKRLLDAGEIGRVLYARAHWGEYLPNWHPWEDYRQGYAARADLGGGVTLTLCHPLDYLRWLVGEPQALWAFTGSQSGLNIAVEDSAEIGLRFSDGSLGSVHLNYFQQPPAHTLEILGTQGSLRWENATGIVTLQKAGNPERQSYYPPEGFERNCLFLSEMQHFIQVVRGEAKPRCTLEDGICALRLALAALRSAEMQRLVQLN